MGCGSDGMALVVRISVATIGGREAGRTGEDGKTGPAVRGILTVAEPAKTRKGLQRHITQAQEDMACEWLIQEA